MSSPDFPPAVIPDGVSIMEQFAIALTHMLTVLEKNPTMKTGVLNMITPEGTQPAPKGFDGDGGVYVPWGVSIDGDDDVWFGNFWGRGVGLMAGADPKSVRGKEDRRSHPRVPERQLSR